MKQLITIGLPLYLFVTGVLGAISGAVGIIISLFLLLLYAIFKMNADKLQREEENRKPNSTEPTNLNAKDQELLDDLVRTFAMSGASRELAIQQYYNIKAYNRICGRD